MLYVLLAIAALFFSTNSAEAQRCPSQAWGCPNYLHLEVRRWDISDYPYASEWRLNNWYDVGTNRRRCTYRPTLNEQTNVIKIKDTRGCWMHSDGRTLLCPGISYGCYVQAPMAQPYEFYNPWHGWSPWHARPQYDPDNYHWEDKREEAPLLPFSRAIYRPEQKTLQCIYSSPFNTHWYELEIDRPCRP